jgi:hypothetical protein
MSLPPLESGCEQRVFDNKLVIKTVYQKHTLFRKASPVIARNAQYLKQVKDYLGSNFKSTLTTDKTNQVLRPNAGKLMSAVKLNCSYDNSLPSNYLPMHSVSMEAQAVVRPLRFPTISKFKRMQSVLSSGQITAECLSIKSAPLCCKSENPCKEPVSTNDADLPQLSEINGELANLPRARRTRVGERRADLYSMEMIASLKSSTPFHKILDSAVSDTPKNFQYMHKFDRLCSHPPSTVYSPSNSQDIGVLPHAKYSLYGQCYLREELN